MAADNLFLIGTPKNNYIPINSVLMPREAMAEEFLKPLIMYQDLKSANGDPTVCIALLKKLHRDCGSRRGETEVTARMSCSKCYRDEVS